MKNPLKEIEMLADYCEMDLINGVQNNLEEWTDVVDKVRAWVEAAEQSVHPTALRLWQIAWFIQFIAWLITLVFYIGCG